MVTTGVVVWVVVWVVVLASAVWVVWRGVLVHLKEGLRG